MNDQTKRVATVGLSRSHVLLALIAVLTALALLATSCDPQDDQPETDVQNAPEQQDPDSGPSDLEGLPGEPTPAAQPTSGGDPVPDTIVGPITDAQTNAGVMDAVVEVDGTNGPSATTGVNGEYIIFGLSPGTRNVCVTPPANYMPPACKSVTLTSGMKNPVSVPFQLTK